VVWWLTVASLASACVGGADVLRSSVADTGTTAEEAGSAASPRDAGVPSDGQGPGDAGTSNNRERGVDPLGRADAARVDARDGGGT
jgi:hypothetical protein